MPALLVLLYMGIQKKWWPSLSALPILNVRATDLAEQPGTGRGEPRAAASQGAGEETAAASREPAASSSSSTGASSSSRPAALEAGSASSAEHANLLAGGPDKKSVKQSSQEVKRMRGEAKHLLHFCANMLANPFSNSLTEQTQMLCEPLCEFIDRMRTICSGSEQWHLELISGSLDAAVQKTWQLLSDSEMLETAGYCSRDGFEARTEAEIEDDNKLAAVLFETFAHVATQFTLSGMTWTKRYPGRFVSLLEPDTEQQKQNMLRVKEDFQLFVKLQEAATQSPFAKSFMSDLQWPLQTFVVEVFYMLYETEFSQLTDELRSSLQGFSRSWLASVIDEEAFNYLRGNSTNQSAGAMGRSARWGNLCASPLLSQHGRQTVQVTSTARAQAKGVVPSSAFVATSAADFDLGADVLETMNSPGWPHPSPAGHKLVGAAWEALRAANGNMEKVARSWQSLLASPGCLLADKDKQVVGIVLGCTPWCLFYMATLSHRLSNGKLLIRPDPNCQVHTLVIQDAKEWHAMKAGVVAPVQVAAWAKSARCSPGLAWTVQPGGPLLRRAAREGFRMMTKPFLDKLVALEKLVFKKNQEPKTVADTVRALVILFLTAVSK